MTNYQHARSLGLCGRCQTRDAIPGATACAYCLPRRRAQGRAYDLKRRPRPADAPPRYCSQCGEAGHNRQRCAVVRPQPVPVVRDPRAADQLADEVLP